MSCGKQTAVISFLLLNWLSIANGKLWETKPEIEARYGHPTRVEDHVVGKTYVYNYNRITVLVTFLNGKSQSEVYSRTDGKYLVPVEVVHLLELNTVAKHTWAMANGMFVLVNSVRKGKPIAIAARYPDTAYPRRFSFCTADFVKKFGGEADRN
jgi:hypothetical protein